MRSYNSLQSLRGIFAIFIFFHHLNLFQAGGDSGVCFFIVLSGFVMSTGYAVKLTDRQVSYKYFLCKRLKRLFPYHIIGFILALLLMTPFYGSQTPLIWGANIMMLQSWIPLPAYYFSCDSPSWCLSDLMFCYAVFPFFIKSINKLSYKHCLLFLLVILSAYFSYINLLPQSLWTPLIYINPLFRLYDFILGILLWRFMNSATIKNCSAFITNLNYYVKSLIETVVILIFCTWIILYYSVSEKYGLASYWWGPTLLIIICFASFDNNGGCWTKFFKSKILVWFGSLSFAFYMAHVPIIKGYNRFFQHFYPNIESSGFSILSIIIIFILTLLLSAIVYYKIEPKSN